jgi:hypothetical protein
MPIFFFHPVSHMLATASCYLILSVFFIRCFAFYTRHFESNFLFLVHSEISETTEHVAIDTSHEFDNFLRQSRHRMID